MAERRGEYVVHVALPDGGIRPAADLRLVTDARGRHRRSAIRYRSGWLDHPACFALDRVHAPLQPDAIDRETADIPAVIDEVLPGQWERAVIARAWQAAGHGGDPADLHAVLGAERLAFRVGAVEIVPADAASPALDAPLAVAQLEQLAADADAVARQHDPEIAALERLRAGSSVGGARPKVVVRDDAGAYIAKLTRPGDPFNHARVEHVCLELARRAGLEAPASRIVRAGRFDALLVERFDVTPDGGRHHLVSANALLKDPSTQADPIHARYDDLVALIQRHSDRPAADLRRLFARMLVNEAINNADDHLRNFSFRLGEEGFRLAPAYDLVPADVRGSYPSLTLGNHPGRPKPEPEQARAAARIFQLPPREANGIVARIRDAFTELPEILDDAEVADSDRRVIDRVVWRPE